MRINFKRSVPPSGPVGKFLAAIVGLLALAAAVMFSLVFVVVVVVAGLIAWGYFWWKTRALRRQLRDQRPAASSASDEHPPSGEVIEGEAVRVVDEQNRISG